MTHVALVNAVSAALLLATGTAAAQSAPPPAAPAPYPAPAYAPAPYGNAPYGPGPYAVPYPPNAVPPPAPYSMPAPAPNGGDAAASRSPAAAHSGVREHDGFYFRFALGAGGLSFAANDASSKDSRLDGAGVDGKGLAIPVHLAFGGTIAPGLVLGGAIVGAQATSPSYSLRNRGEKLETDSGGALVVSSIGPFVDFYPDPYSGLHFESAIGLLVAKAAQGDKSGGDAAIPGHDMSGTGFSVEAGAGYELWAGDQWSAGLLASAQYGRAKLESTEGDHFAVTPSFLVLGLLGSLTYH